MPRMLNAVGGDGDAVEALGRLAFVADVRRSCRCRRRVASNVRVASRPVRDSRGTRRPCVRVRTRSNEPIAIVAIRIGDRQAADQHRVHEREHRGVDADAERQRDRGDQREPLVFQKQASSESNIFPKTHGIPFEGRRVDLDTLTDRKFPRFHAPERSRVTITR